MKYVQVSKTLTNQIRYVQENDRIEDARTYCCMKTLLKYLELLLGLSEFMCSKIQKIVKKFRNNRPTKIPDQRNLFLNSALICKWKRP